MKIDIKIQVKWLMLFMFMLFSSITQASADSISSVSGPTPIHRGEDITVTIDCEASNKDLIVTLQKTTSPWTGFYVKRTQCNNNRKTTVTFTVPTTIPDGTPLMYQAYLTQKGKNWADRVDVEGQSDVTLVASDITNPTITLKGLNPLNLNKGATYIEAGATALDDVDGNVSASILIGGDTVDTFKAGTYTVTYNVSDEKGNKAVEVNRTVNISDTIITPPTGNNLVISETPWIANTKNSTKTNPDGSVTMTRPDETGYKFLFVRLSQTGRGGALSRDLVEGEKITLKVRAKSSSKDSYIQSLYLDFPLTHFAEENVYQDFIFETTVKPNISKYAWLGLFLKKTGDTVTVKSIEILVGDTPQPTDDTAPVITLKGLNPLNLNLGATYIEAGATAIDDVDGDIGSRIVISGDTVDTNTPDTYTVVYTVSDVAGNKATTTRDVIVHSAESQNLLKGTNFAGGEFENATFPKANEMDKFVDKGMNVFRLPFRWESLQPTLNASFDTDYLKSIKEYVTHAKSKGVKIVLDLHDYACYKRFRGKENEGNYSTCLDDSNRIGGNSYNSNDDDNLVKEFADVWRKLAIEFKDNDNVIFGLMNEPHHIKAKVWLDAANVAIKTIRETGAKNLILVPGVEWTGGATWVSGSNNGKEMGGIKDSLNNYAFEIHQYFDEEFRFINSKGEEKKDYAYSGTYGKDDTCANIQTHVIEKLKKLTNWLKDKEKKGFIGEIGIPNNNSGCENALNEVLKYIQSNKKQWLGWTYWASGSSFGSNYHLFLEANGSKMDVLSNFLKVNSSTNTDTISLVSGPEVIQKGQSITVNVDYKTEDKDLKFMIQETTAPWTRYYEETIESDNHVDNFTFTVSNKIPDGTPLMYQAYLTKKGKGWEDRVAVQWQTGVSLGTVNEDKVISIKGPENIQKGQSIVVNVECRTTGDNELSFSLQKATNPWTGFFYGTRIPCNNNGKTSFTFTVPNNIPDGTPLMYQAYIAPKGKGWADKVDVKGQSGISLSSNSKENFILGVNIGSTSDVTIDNHEWISENDAKTKGMQIDSTHKLFSTTTDVTPVPAVDGDMDTMLNSVRWASKEWNIKQPIGNGTYSVSVWIMENYRSHLRKINLSVEGQAKSAIGDLEKGQWKKYTYSNVKVTDGKLDIVLSGNSDVHMMGFEVLGQTTGPDPIPPVLTLKGANPLYLNVGDTYTELGATAIDNVDGNITADIIIDNSAVDTSKVDKYPVKYTVYDDAGNEATTTRDVIVKPAGDHWKLVVAGRMLKHADDTGFFWMADTAWEMPAKLTTPEIDMYLEDRQKKGFNVIQMSALYGEWKDYDNLKGIQSKMDLWKNIDFIITKAEERGMYIALLPTWSTHLGNFNADSIGKYGQWIANRYKKRPNIIWIIGGDDNSFTKSRGQIWNALGSAIQGVVNQKQLITYHPRGGHSSTEYFSKSDWLDFHMTQSAHTFDASGSDSFFKDYYKKTPKPIIDGEPAYENIRKYIYPDGFVGERYVVKTIRENAYRRIFAGAFGHTYGHDSIWQFWKIGDKSFTDADKEWEDTLDAPGANQMGYLAKLMRSRPILNRVPDQSLIANSSNNDAIATKGNGYAMVYLPTGGSVTVNLNKIASSVKAWWYNPRNGDSTSIGTFQTDTKIFEAQDNEDWVLVFDDASRVVTAPGQ